MSPEPQDNPELTRKGFIKLGFQKLMSQVADSLPVLDGYASAKALSLRPPGARPEKQFLETCEPFCAECRTACPRDAIMRDAFGFPYVDPASAPCVMCNDVPCTRVCPTGALEPLFDPRAIRMGTAVIEVTQCTAYSGSGCRACVDVCPLSGEAITLEESLPVIHADICTGCGICVYECPTPHAIAVIPRG